MSREKICGIYCIRNILDDKKYVGQAEDITGRRWANHIRKLKSNKHENKYLQNCWNKDGENNFEFYIVEKCDIFSLGEREIYYIKFLHSHYTENGYNISWGGDAPMKGRSHSEDSRKKIKESSTGRKHTEESKEKMRKSKIGSVVSDETKQKLKNANLGKKQSSETVLKRIAHIIGVPRTSETKEKISIGNIGKKKTEKYKLEMSERLKKSNPSIGKKYKNSSSVYYGVCFDKTHNKWIATLVLDYKQTHLGYFDDEISAAKAYDLYVIGNHLNRPLNFPE